MVYLLALGSALFYGAADFTGGLTSRRAGAIPVVVISQFSGMLMLALLLPVLPSASPSRDDLLWGAAAGLTGGIGVALLYRALAIGTMAVVAPTTAVCAVAIPVLVAVSLGERPVPLAVAGIVLGIISIILVSQQQATPDAEQANEARRRRLPPGVATAFASGVAIGFFYLSLARSRAEAGMWPLLMARVVSVLLFATLAIATRASFRMTRGVLALVFAAGAIDMFANALYLLASRQGQLSVVVTLSSLYPASTVLLARIILHERLSTWQVTGVVCALAAVMLIVSGGQ
ncbi:MAG: EamA family transporter [Gemmatimonadales bacterium]